MQNANASSWCLDPFEQTIQLSFDLNDLDEHALVPLLGEGFDLSDVVREKTERKLNGVGQPLPEAALPHSRPNHRIFRSYRIPTT